MQGVIRNVRGDGFYGFIKTNKGDYFFHKSEFDGHWADLLEDIDAGEEIEVEFEPTRTDKGLRAVGVRRIYGGV